LNASESQNCPKWEVSSSYDCSSTTLYHKLWRGVSDTNFGVRLFYELVCAKKMTFVMSRVAQRAPQIDADRASSFLTTDHLQWTKRYMVNDGLGGIPENCAFFRGFRRLVPCILDHDNAHNNDLCDYTAVVLNTVMESSAYWFGFEARWIPLCCILRQWIGSTASRPFTWVEWNQYGDPNTQFNLWSTVAVIHVEWERALTNTSTYSKREYALVILGVKSERRCDNHWSIGVSL